jgi:hypothetical protein
MVPLKNMCFSPDLHFPQESCRTPVRFNINNTTPSRRIRLQPQEKILMVRRSRKRTMIQTMTRADISRKMFVKVEGFMINS